MRSATASVLLATWIGIGPACHEKISNMNAKNEAVQVDRRVEKLREIITLPAMPVEVWFEEVPRGAAEGLGPADALLVVAMRFRRDDLARVLETAQTRPGSTPRLSAVAQRPWLPEPLQSAIHTYDDRSVTVRGTKFDAAPFAKSPFLSGSFVALEGGQYIILVLQTS